MLTKAKLLGCGLLPALLAAGCSSMDNTERGAVAGGVFGTAAGAIVGAAAHAPVAGALIGAAAGTAVGAAAGHAEDKQEQRIAAAQRNALPMEQVASMTQQQVSDTIIINQIRTSGAVYYLTADQISWLKSQGVSDAVVSEMQATRYYPRRYYSAEPVYLAEPPVSVGVGVGFGRRW
jgi:hypothetical protein